MVAVGYARGGVAGVSDWPQMYAAYPNPSVVRIFNTSTLPAWTGTSYNVHPTSTVLWLSYKSTTQNISTWLDDLPIARRNKVLLTYNHEPEQELTATQFKTNFDALLNAIAAHPNRAYIQVGPILTASWQFQNGNGANWGDWWSTTMRAQCDFNGWDVYNRAGVVPSDYPDPLSPTHSNGITLKLPVLTSDVLELPWAIGEFGTRRTASDTTGEGAAEWMRKWVEEMDVQACSYACFWHDSGNDLLDLNRTTEIAELQDLVATYTVPGTYPPGGGGGGTPPSTGIEFVDDGQAMNTSAATALPVPTPPGVLDGDHLVAFFGWLSTTVTGISPATFAPLGADTPDGSNLTARILHRTASGEPASYAFGVSSAVKAAGWVGAYRGVHPTEPIYDFAIVGLASTTSHVTPAVDVPAGGWLIYGAVSRDTPGGAGLVTWTSSGTAPAERYDAASNSGSADITMAVYDSGAALSAATNVTRTLTSSAALDNVVAFAIALKPATPPPGSGGATTIPTPGIPV